MLRTFVSFLVVLALVGAPAALSAQGLGARGESHARIDLDGATSTVTSGPGIVSSTACELGACGEGHAAIDPNGLTARPTSGPDLVSSTVCELDSCGEGRGYVDPNGAAAKSTPEAPIPMLLAWLRALLAL